MDCSDDSKPRHDLLELYTIADITGGTIVDIGPAEHEQLKRKGRTFGLHCATCHRDWLHTVDTDSLSVVEDETSDFYTCPGCSSQTTAAWEAKFPEA